MDCVVFDLGGVVFRYDPEKRWARLAELSGRTCDGVRKFEVHRYIDAPGSQQTLQRFELL